MPESVPAALAALLGDRVVEVRCSALHALKRLCRLRPALVRARRCAAEGDARRRRGGVRRQAPRPRRQRRAADDARARARVRLDRRRARARELADTEHGGFVADYARRHLKRQREMDSEADSDGDGD